jgi:hypothetical protein
LKDHVEEPLPVAGLGLTQIQNEEIWAAVKGTVNIRSLVEEEVA